MSRIPVAAMMMSKGMPTQKVREMIPPGPNTIMLVWYPKGVAKACEAAIITVMAKGTALTPRLWAAPIEPGTITRTLRPYPQS